MKKILLVNQHSSNHGDEAAARALTRQMSQKNADFSMLYNASGDNFKLDLPLTFSNLRNTRAISTLEKLQVMASIYLPVWLVSPFFSRDVRKEYDMIASSDMVISMPGGANLGLYNDWRYLWRLLVAQRLGKKTAIYSVSIGPFKDNPFRKFTFKALKNADWLSLRDAKSIEYGRSEGIEFHESIDTAFLVQDFPNEDSLALSDFDIPFEAKSYSVFVPNNLKTGHITFRGIKQEDLDNIYLSLLNKSLKTGHNVVMLPQLFGNGNDRDYFKKIAARSDDPSRIFVAAEDILSDNQQFIIRNALFVVGARYHSIIFAINTSTPFLCLSYENKMKFTLERLDRPELSIDLTELAGQVTHHDVIDRGIAQVAKLAAGEITPADANKALNIAKRTYDDFEKTFLHDL